jgi:glutamate-5-semialdehyde dehydrogenase
LQSIRTLAEEAKLAARDLSRLSSREKDAALLRVAAKLRENRASIIAANEKDKQSARAAGLSSALVERLEMGEKQIESTARGVEYVVSLPDPVGQTTPLKRLSNGLLVGRQRAPLGVIAMVYEARPNVTVDAFSLCLKSGNAVLLRGGKEARESNAVLGELIKQALRESNLPPASVGIVPPGERESIRELLSLSDLIDLAIPRGGEGLIRFVAENARVPVIKHYKGVCHLFVDAGARHEMAVDLVLNGKLQKPAACNALECLLVHAAEARTFLPLLMEGLVRHAVEVRGCPRTREILSGVVAATEADWGAEYLANVLAIRVVDDIGEALDHIARYGSNHTESICTENYTHSQRWLREVDASCVLVNASTRFNDGGELGLGAEVGISTSKLHAYGPMGLESLTTEKWIVFGEGQVRSG